MLGKGWGLYFLEKLLWKCEDTSDSTHDPEKMIPWCGHTHYNKNKKCPKKQRNNILTRNKTNVFKNNGFHKYQELVDREFMQIKKYLERQTVS